MTLDPYHQEMRSNRETDEGVSLNQCEAIRIAHISPGQVIRCQSFRTEVVNGHHLCWTHKHAYLTGPRRSVFDTRPSDPAR